MREFNIYCRSLKLKKLLVQWEGQELDSVRKARKVQNYFLIGKTQLYSKIYSEITYK